MSGCCKENIDRLRIHTLLEAQDGCELSVGNKLYHAAIRDILGKILPQDILQQIERKDVTLKEMKALLEKYLPHLAYSPISHKLPLNLSFFALTKYRANCFKFFFEMISSWLVPGRRLNVIMLYAVDFYLPDISDELYTLCEVRTRIDNEEELKQIVANLPNIETELKLGMPSAYYASRIMDIKGFSSDEKTVKIQEYIASLVKRLPKHFSRDVFTEMQNLLVMCSEEFKLRRGWRHLSRIISYLYLFRKWLQDAVKTSPSKRHVRLKLFKALLNRSPEAPKKVLGLVIGINFLKYKEILEERHILKAIQNNIPNTQVIANSFLLNKGSTETICTLYIEIEKGDGKDFTLAELQKLRKKLPNDLKERVEHLMRPVFMPSNEEEVMRNIVALSNQIKYVNDLPQVIISFEKQTYSHLVFLVIIARVNKEGTLSVKEMFKKASTTLRYVHDRCKVVGFVRKKYEKEVTVFKVNMPIDNYSHDDHTIDLFKARQKVVAELTRIVGGLRDFNGGMISKQNEVLSELHSMLGEKTKYSYLLENFFYSMTPGILRNVLEPETFKILFHMLLESVEYPLSDIDSGCHLQIHIEPNYVFALVTSQIPSIQEEINKELEDFVGESSTELARTFVTIYDKNYLGFIYQCSYYLRQLEFCQALEFVCKRRQKVGVLQ